MALTKTPIELSSTPSIVDGGNATAITIDSSENTTFAGTVTISTADNNPQLTLVSTDTDANIGPVLSLWRNSSSPADGDDLGRIYFYGENDADEKIEMVLMRSSLVDASDGSEDSSFQLYTYVGGAQADRIKLDSTETVFNESSKDVDFRVESNGNANMLFVDGGNDIVTIGGSTYESSDTFSVIDSGANSVNTRLVNNNDDANGVHLILEKNSSSPGDNDELGQISFFGKDDAGNANTFAAIQVFADDVTNGTEDGSMVFSTAKGAAFTQQMKLNSNGYVDFTGAADIRVTFGSTGTAGNNDANWVRGENSDLAFNAASGDHKWEVGGTAVARLDADGLRFGSDTAADNGLDDYEEGAWTPVLDGLNAGDYTMGGSNAGRYTKVGDVVVATATVQWTARTTAYSGHLLISGYPFACGTVRAAGTLAAVNSGLTFSSGTYDNYWSINIDPGNTYAYIIENGDGTYGHNPTVGTSGLIYTVTLVYKTS